MKNIKRFLCLVFALAMMFSLASVASAQVVDSTAANWNRTYYCVSCGKALSLDFDVTSDSGHARGWVCTNSACPYDINSTTTTITRNERLQYTINAGHTYDSSGTCTVCGYYDASQAACTHPSSYYSYSYYNSSYHTYSQICNSCGETLASGLETHSWYTGYSQYSSTQHTVTQTCYDCGYSTTGYASHSDGNGDGLCDDCGYSMAVTVTWNASTNGGTVNGGSSVTTSVTSGAVATAPGYTPVKTGYSFAGWYTAASGGSLYNTVAVTAARTFYAQFTANSYAITWSLGDGATTTTSQTYGTALTLPTTPTKAGYTFKGWYTAATGGTQVTSSTTYTTAGATTYYAQWEQLDVFSVTVPATLPLAMAEDGSIHMTAAAIVNNSTGEVKVTGVTVNALNGWTLVPYNTNMAQAKVDGKQVGFSLNGSQTTAAGTSQLLSLTGNWTISESGSLALDYDAVVSAMSEPLTNEAILSVVFVLEWA